jgi:putative methyltransferase (TIGR04325 family)
MGARAFAETWLAPGVVRLGRQVLARLRPAPWEVVPEGWRGSRIAVRGWEAESVAAAEAAKWADFARLVAGTGPLGVAHEARQPGDRDYAAHNTIMAFAYVLTLAARNRERLSVLDWGGGLGHYYLLAKALVPGLELDYHCKDLAAMCRRGRELLPEVRFHDDAASCLTRRYDLVLASSSLHYSEHWRDVAAQLAGVTGSYLFVTRTPTVSRSPSFVVVQRHYGTEYLGWFLNRAELGEALHGLGMELVREFLIDERPFVHRAPEPCEYRGFLWRPSYAALET